ncbi:hypothetical protein SAMN04488156_1356 [Bacillus sp. 166amftsu]|nr:hypothetical protein SAMN04488156_1356 [Bacillus sp. 166amftsu]
MGAARMVKGTTVAKPELTQEEKSKQKKNKIVSICKV